MRLEFLFLGKTREPYLATGIDDFAGRLKHYAKVTVKILKDKRAGGAGSDRQNMEAEAKVLLQARSKGSLLVALDRQGRQVASEELAQQLLKWQMQGAKTVSFVIGGPVGLDPSVLAEADYVIALSKMTFTHEMTRLLLMEQLYRACTINAGEKYHK